MELRRDGLPVEVPLVRAAVARVLGRPSLEHELSLRPPRPHQANRLYDVRADGRQLIAKEYLEANARNGARHEYAALQLVQPIDIALQPAFFDPSLGPVVIYAFLDGVMWDRRVPSAAELAASGSPPARLGRGRRPPASRPNRTPSSLDSAVR